MLNRHRGIKTEKQRLRSRRVVTKNAGRSRRSEKRGRSIQTRGEKPTGRGKRTAIKKAVNKLGCGNMKEPQKERFRSGVEGLKFCFLEPLGLEENAFQKEVVS